MPISTTNPATGRRIRSYRVHTRRDVEFALESSSRAFGRWRDRPLAERSRLLRSVASVLRRRADGLALLCTEEMGKVLPESLAEVKKCGGVCTYYARRGRAFLRDERPPHAPKGARVVFQPLGPLLAIMPWNFPFWQVFRAAAPALMAGNTMLLKHASNVTGCARAIEAVFLEAGFPRGVFQTLVIPASRVGALLADDRVAAVTLTGSTEAGKRVASQAGAAMKKGVFELGGSDAYIILGDADIALAAETCAASRLLNAGQSCISAKRFIVVRPVLRAFERAFTQRILARPVGSPLDPANKVGPLAREDLRRTLHQQVRASVKRGARLVVGGSPLPGDGFYFAPTVLADVAKGMPAYDEELFGPVAAIIPVRDEAEAIRVANDTEFGLGAAVFTRRRKTAERVAARIEAGSVFVNALVRSDPALPFGGVKQSGHGRELGPYGIREFVNMKTLCFG
jgi:succinate-semialdehyde dehydrogenase/glutarate-semialdehyde dehydrogenase